MNYFRIYADADGESHFEDVPVAMSGQARGSELSELYPAVGVIFRRNPIYGALSLVGCFFFLAGVYVLLGAHLIAVLQVLVYAGAVMVLFVFVIMLLNLKDAELGEKRITAWKGLGLAAVVVAIGVIAWKALGPAFPQGALLQGDRRVDNAVLVAGFGGGGVHGYNALEGTFLGGCIFSGRTAGRDAAGRL